MPPEDKKNTAQLRDELSIRVYYEDTDAGGVVYYANYLKFAERGRTELLRTANIDNSSLWENDRVSFVVRHVEANYLSPARLDDRLIVATEISAIEAAGLRMTQNIYRDGDLLFSGDFRLVCVNDRFRPARLPKTVVNRLSGKQNA